MLCTTRVVNFQSFGWRSSTVGSQVNTIIPIERLSGHLKYLRMEAVLCVFQPGLVTLLSPFLNLSNSQWSIG